MRDEPWISPVKIEGQPGSTEILVSEIPVVHNQRSERMHNCRAVWKILVSAQEENQIIVAQQECQKERKLQWVLSLGAKRREIRKTLWDQIPCSPGLSDPASYCTNPIIIKTGQALTKSLNGRKRIIVFPAYFTYYS